MQNDNPYFLSSFKEVFVISTDRNFSKPPS